MKIEIRKTLTLTNEEFAQLNNTLRLLGKIVKELKGNYFTDIYGYTIPSEEISDAVSTIQKLYDFAEKEQTNS